MMNKIRTWALISLLLACVSNAFGADAPAGWTWRRLIEPGAAPKGLVRLSLTPEIFDSCQSSLRDLRLFDAEGAPRPYLLLSGEKAGPPTRHQAWLRDSKRQLGRYARVEACFGSVQPRDRLTIYASGTNHCRRVMVEGRQMQEAWTILTDCLWLADIQNDEFYRLNTLSMPLNNFKHLRVTVYNMPGETRTLYIYGISVYKETPPEAPLIPVPAVRFDSRVDEKSGDTIVEVDLGFKHLPLALATLHCLDPLFHRGILVEGRNALTKEARRDTETGYSVTEQDMPWQAVAQGVIYRGKNMYRTDESLGLPFRDAPYRYLRLTIRNADNPPLTVTGLEVERRDVSLQFMHQDGAVLFLYGGNPAAVQPNYDLGKAISPRHDAPTVGVGAVEVLEVVKESLPWTERHAWLIWVVLAAATLALAALVYSSLRNLSPAEDNTENAQEQDSQ